jgi:hypothetical protein
VEDLIEWDSLVGEHELSGVDRYNAEIQGYWGARNAEAISFTLDGITYTAVEDENDGYRSAMDRLSRSDVVLKNTFPPVRVIARMAPSDRWETHEVLELINPKNGQTVLKVGTGNVDDYYPYFVATFNPENL